MYAPNPSEMDTKVLIPAPISHFKIQLISLNGNRKMKIMETHGILATIVEKWKLTE